MKKQLLARLAVIAVLALGLMACSGGEKDAGSTPAEGTAAVETPAAAPEATPEAPAAAPEDLPGDEPEIIKDPNRFVTEYTPGAVYSLSDLPVEGSFVKIQFNDLTDAQMNQVVHRLKTELCTCGCPKDTIEECMVNDPACGTAPELARQIIREEMIK